jgi:hypothetical protein
MFLGAQEPPEVALWPCATTRVGRLYLLAFPHAERRAESRPSRASGWQERVREGDGAGGGERGAQGSEPNSLG